jgi:hypothetical protein
MRALAVLVLVAAGAAGAAASAQCEDCVLARYWQVDPTYWRSASPDVTSYPEHQLETPLAGADLGVAFSGGGTRSAAATIGQLRGLLRNGWLERVKYVTAVSGGSWAAVPFVYYPGDDLNALLGEYQPDLTRVDLEVFRRTPHGLLAGQVARSGLAASGIEETLPFLPDRIAGRDIARYRDLAIRVRGAVRRLRGTTLPEATRRNKTFAHMLGQIFLDPLVPDSNRRPYTWTFDAALDISRTSRQGQMDFQQVPRGRPFLIAGGTMIWNRPGFVYPRLIPVEYTPLYTGVRQQFGNLGGTYVMPWAYDRARVAVAGDHLLVDKAGVRMFTLADVIGSSGAAPQLALMLGSGVPERARSALLQAAGAFPAFNPVAVRDGTLVRPDGEIAHGDGGFTDNLGLMPLLARQVRHIIAFVNSNKTYLANDQLQSYFFPLAVQTGGGDKTFNDVFPQAKYRELILGLDAARTSGGPAIFCQTTAVRPNEVYNIAAYDGLKICWVYNAVAEEWKRNLPEAIQGWLAPGTGLDQLRHFPYFETFGENRPFVVKLHALQVNLLADLACWNLTSPSGRAAIAGYFGAKVLSLPE